MRCRTWAVKSETVNPPGAGARASAAARAAEIRAVQGGGEPVRHAGEPGDDLLEVLQAATAAQLFGVVHGGLEAQHVLALGIGLQLEPPEADPEPAQAIPWFLDHDFLRGR